MDGLLDGFLVWKAALIFVLQCSMNLKKKVVGKKCLKNKTYFGE